MSFQIVISFNMQDLQAMKDEIFSLYFQDTGILLDKKNISEQESRDFIQWFYKKRREDTRLFSIAIRDVVARVPSLSTNISQKVNTLSQYDCPICSTNEGPCISFPIRISPQSKQSMACNKRAAFELGIKGYLNSINFFDLNKFDINEKICIHLVFVLGLKSKDKDVDNMAKALLDAIKGILFGDDANVDHLSVLKIRHGYEDDWITCTIQPTKINSTEDLMVPGIHHGWEQMMIDLDDYMGTSIN